MKSHASSHLASRRSRRLLVLLAGVLVVSLAAIGLLDLPRSLTILAVIGYWAVAARLDIAPGLEGIYASDQNGLFVEAVRPFGLGWIGTMPNSFFVAKARYDLADFDADLEGDSERRFTVGINFRPSADAVLKLDYFRGRLRDRFNNRADEAGVLFSIATYF